MAGLDELGLKPGDHLRHRAAEPLAGGDPALGLPVRRHHHHAAQLAREGRRARFLLAERRGQGVVYEAVVGRRGRTAARRDRAAHCGRAPDRRHRFDALVGARRRDAAPRADAEAWSVMLYTSGTTAQPKGVPRRQRAERAAALAHVAQNLYAHGERTLGVMPLYHTMGVRSLLAMSLIGGAFVCLPRFDVRARCELIEAREDHQPLSGADALSRPRPSRALRRDRRRSVRKLGFAGAPMTDGLLKALHAAFRPELFVNHYGSSEIYTFTIDQNAPAKPGSAGRAGINQMMRVVRLGAAPDEIAAAGRGRRDHRASRRATRPSRATGGGRTPTPRRCATAGTSPATPAISTRTATCSSPAGSTT